jgi:HK97 gp10 family phage protein
MNLNDLANKLNNMTKQIEKETSNKAVDFALDLLDELAESTPVDTSKAVSNWQVSIITPETREIDAHILGRKGSSKDMSIEIVRMEAKNTLSAKIAGDSIFITNNADYIADLNNGTSIQAPAGFIEASIMRAKQRLKK